IISHLKTRMPNPDFSQNKLGGPENIVQVDETMMDFKCKSHKGRESINRTDVLCSVEFFIYITRVFATVIPDKSSSTLIPIICSQVAPNIVI
ncbi:hypothetical protein COBT_002228, partial [Conglomerata obtusa]